MRRDLRVLYVQPAPLFGGAERQAVEQAAYLRDFGMEVTVVTGPGTTIIDWLEAKGVASVVPSQNFPGRWPKQKGLMKATLPFRVVRCGVEARDELERLVGSERFDVMLASLPFSWITASLVARRHGIPIAWRAGGAYINPAQAAGMWAVTRFLRPDLLICNSRAVERTFSPVIPAPVAILPNGVDTEHFRPDTGDPTRYRPLGAGLVVGYAGRVATRKRPQDVVAMAARLRRHVPLPRLNIARQRIRPTH
jgi:glycosyltransferase involved in cell wall biosynthesis